jgi:Tol biopolymer transport system component
MPLTTGSRIGPYEILALIGAGGMGQVYRARDTKLGREVAVKVLPDALASDPDRLARFDREARILASLNHPNIAGIYGLEESSGIRALVLEFVEGPTLADRVADGPLSIAESLNIASQLADALEAAHEQGITHRDLKPANIKVRPDGVVKVLDFGLAKLAERTGSSPTDADAIATTMSPATTGVGVILGTAAYMSPEQAKGQAADKRSDIWAFGCVLFEMLTGRRLFHGRDLNETIALVLTKDPDWGLLPPATPQPIHTLLRRCVERDRRKRVGDVAAIRFVLDERGTAGPASPTPVAHAGAGEGAWPRMLAIGAVALVALAAIGGAFFRGVSRQPPPAVTDLLRFSIELPEGWRLNAPDGIANQPLAVSPDGSRIVFIGRNALGATVLVVRSLDSATAMPLPGTEGAAFPFWSPDGTSVAFWTSGSLKRVAVAGGVPVTICDCAPRGIFGGAWAPDGTIIVSNIAPTLMRVQASGGSPVPLTKQGPGEGFQMRPVLLPDGRHFLFVVIGPERSQSRVFVASLDAPDERTRVPVESSTVGYANGHLLFMRGTTLVAQAFDDRRFTLSGEAASLVDDVRTQTQTTVFGVFSAADRMLAYQSGTGGAHSLVWLDRAGHQLGSLGDRGTYTNLDLSSDGTRLLAGVVDPARRTRDIWTFDTARGVGTRVTSDPSEERSAGWSPDGRSIVFNSLRTGFLELYRKAADGTGAEELLLADSRSNKDVCGWSPDGQYVLYRGGTRATSNDLMVLPLAGEQQPFPFVATGFNESSGVFSPDGRWIAYVSDESGKNDVYVAAFPGASGRVRVSTDGGNFPRWRGDGRELFYVAPDNMLEAVEIATAGRAEPAVGPPRDLFTVNVPTGSFSPYVVTKDGQRFLVNTDVGSAASISIVANWAEALGRNR